MNAKPSRDLAALPPLQPMDSSGTPVLRTTKTFVDDPNVLAFASMKSTMSAERRRHGQVEKILTAYNESLERQIADLRELYMRSLSIKVGPNV